MGPTYCEGVQALIAENEAAFIAENPPERRSFGRLETKLIKQEHLGCRVA